MNPMPHRMESWRSVFAAAGMSAAVLAAPAQARTQTADVGTPPPQSPIVNSIAGQPTVLEVRKPAAAPRRMVHHVARSHHRIPRLDLDRPALAGVLLVEPIPGPFKGPRPIVPMPAYFLDSVASDFTTPPPPIVCEHRRRDPALPDPHLYHEVPLVCGYDIE